MKLSRRPLYKEPLVKFLYLRTNKAYRTRRYGRVEEDKKRCRLFLICNPVSRVGKQQAHVVLWDPTQGCFTRTADVDESLSALAVRDDGRFVAVGTMFTGTVEIYIAFSLQVSLEYKIYYFWAYQIQIN